MTTVREIVSYLMPNGSRGKEAEFEGFPLWPPDLFGVAAFVAEKTDAQTLLLDVSNAASVGSIIQRERDQLINIGESLADDSDVEMFFPEVVKDLENVWGQFINSRDCVESCNSTATWLVPLFKLLIISDIASAGIGFHDNSEPGEDQQGLWVGRVFDWMSFAVVRSELDSLLPSSAGWYKRLEKFVSTTLSDPSAMTRPSESVHSACILIPSNRLCVLPKALTPLVGCTVRSLSHNLSLHPSSSQAKSRWFNHSYHHRFVISDNLNVLVIPYPFSIEGSCFEVHKEGGGHFQTFGVNQKWLGDLSGFEDVVRALLLEAKKESGVDVVVFPELSLNDDALSRAIDIVSDVSEGRFTTVIAGVAINNDGAHVNSPSTTYVTGGDWVQENQAKHHRWRLDSSQVKAYSLGSCFNGGGGWWENTDVSGRTVDYHVFQKGGCFATLICEDLARQDPCKPSVQAVGPNLVFALLMDAPQLKFRWPGRYALGLTEDPGSSVLTVTSLGMLERSNWAHASKKRVIALWGSGDGAEELELPVGSQALLLSLARSSKKLYTLDRGGSGNSWSLRGCVPLNAN